MTFRKIVESLPNGLHDAELQGFQMDYLHQRLILDVILWISKKEAARELYRPARLTFDDVRFLLLEPPRNLDETCIAGSIRIDAGEGIPDGVNCGPHAAEAGSMTWVFLNDLNSFLMFSAGRGSLEWTGDAENRSDKR